MARPTLRRSLDALVTGGGEDDGDGDDGVVGDVCAAALAATRGRSDLSIERSTIRITSKRTELNRIMSISRQLHNSLNYAIH